MDAHGHDARATVESDDDVGKLLVSAHRQVATIAVADRGAEQLQSVTPSPSDDAHLHGATRLALFPLPTPALMELGYAAGDKPNWLAATRSNCDCTIVVLTFPWNVVATTETSRRVSNSNES